MTISNNFGTTLDELNNSAKELQSALSRCQNMINETKKKMESESIKEEMDAMYADCYYRNNNSKQVIYIREYDPCSGKLVGICYRVEYNSNGNSVLVLDTNYRITPAELEAKIWNKKAYTEITPDFFFDYVKQYGNASRVGCYGYSNFQVR